VKYEVLYLNSRLVLIQIIQFDNSVHIQTAPSLPNDCNNLPTRSRAGEGGPPMNEWKGRCILNYDFEQFHVQFI
jgi:hypothetical protein